MNKQNKIKNQIKKQQSPAKGSRRKSKKGKFIVPTVEEMNQDRHDYMEQRKSMIIKDGDGMLSQRLNINYRETLINFRREQLGMDTEFKIVNDVNIQEHHEGALKSVEMLTVELDIDLYIYKTQIREYERMKEKFVKEYKFSTIDIQLILQGTFDWITWGKKDDKLKDTNNSKD